MNELSRIVKLQKSGEPKGICSVCSSSMFVIDAAIIQAIKTDACVLIEATANQVNQYGGYTGMKPSDYRDMVYKRAETLGLSQDRIILGGDHLGPVAWKKQSADEAMALADVLVFEFCKAGYAKIHLDASMPLGSEVTLSTEEIADRTVRLCIQAEKGYAEYKKHCPDSTPPVYVIGSEVPTPGGSGDDDALSVTKPSALIEMLDCFESKFQEAGLEDAWSRVIAAVVQPGVEFGNIGIHKYVPEEAIELVATAKELSNIVLEGHSTDYQPEDSLKKMVEDGVAILKVGPALTFAAREGLYALAFVEKEMNFEIPSNFIEVLDKAMIDNPGNWSGHYTSIEPESTFLRKYSLSDRSRYYMNVTEVEKAIKQLFDNLESADIPMSLLSQFAPAQGKKIRNGELDNSPYAIVIDKVREVLGEYWYACGWLSRA